MKKEKLATLAPHAGGDEEAMGAGRPLVDPIYQTSAFSFAELDAADQVQKGEQPGYIYSRMGNPTVERLEKALTQWEGAESALVTASGMAAITAALFALTSPGDRIVAGHELYGGTSGLLGLMDRFHLSVDLVDINRPHSVKEALSKPARLVLVETITNPTVGVADLPAIAGWAHDAGAYLLVDNTFATPYFCQPLKDGADLVVHSLTKFIGGHGDLTGGVCLTRHALMESIKPVATLLGAAADPFAAWLALRGLKTLALRMEKSAANALVLARRLSEHPAVQTVYYPGLTTHPTHDVAQRVLPDGFGAMFSFALRGGALAARRLVERAQLIRFVASLGDVATTLSYPSTTSHRGLTGEQQAELGITPGLVRISTGIEDAGDLWQDLRRGLED